jgi:hypothetical protein
VALFCEEFCLCIDLLHKRVQAPRTLILEMRRWPDRLVKTSGQRETGTFRERAKLQTSKRAPTGPEVHGLYAKVVCGCDKGHETRWKPSVNVKRHCGEVDREPWRNIA